jgi:phage shock protein A
MATPSPFKRIWRYVKAALTFRFDELADPRIQLEQAIQEASENHQRLKESAASVIANQKQTQLKLERRSGELEQLQVNARQALLMAEDARTGGDDAKAAQFEATAETIATKLVAVENEVDDLQEMLLQAAKHTDQAKAAVDQSSHLLRQKMAEKDKLVGQIDRAKMNESMNEAMSTLTESVGKDVPTFSEVQEKIERRLARAQGARELGQDSAESRMLEVERASANVEAKARLSQLRSELGLSRGESPAPSPAADQTAPATRPGDTPGTGQAAT